MTSHRRKAARKSFARLRPSCATVATQSSVAQISDSRGVWVVLTPA